MLTCFWIFAIVIDQFTLAVECSEIFSATSDTTYFTNFYTFFAAFIIILTSAKSDGENKEKSEKFHFYKNSCGKTEELSMENEAF